MVLTFSGGPYPEGHRHPAPRAVYLNRGRQHHIARIQAVARLRRQRRPPHRAVVLPGAGKILAQRTVVGNQLRGLVRLRQRTPRLPRQARQHVDVHAVREGHRVQPDVRVHRGLDGLVDAGPAPRVLAVREHQDHQVVVARLRRDPPRKLDDRVVQRRPAILQVRQRVQVRVVGAAVAREHSAAHLVAAQVRAQPPAGREREQRHLVPRPEPAHEGLGRVDPGVAGVGAGDAAALVHQERRRVRPQRALPAAHQGLQRVLHAHARVRGQRVPRNRQVRRIQRDEVRARVQREQVQREGQRVPGPRIQRRLQQPGGGLRRDGDAVPQLPDGDVIEPRHRRAAVAAAEANPGGVSPKVPYVRQVGGSDVPLAELRAVDVGRIPARREIHVHAEFGPDAELQLRTVPAALRTVRNDLAVRFVLDDFDKNGEFIGVLHPESTECRIPGAGGIRVTIVVEIQIHPHPPTHADGVRQVETEVPVHAEAPP